MNLRELKTAINSIHDDYDQYSVRTMPTSTSAMITVTPDLIGRRLHDATLIDGVLLIQEATIE